MRSLQIIRGSSELSSLLQQKFYENLSKLVDLNLTIKQLFGNEEYSGFDKGTMEPDFKRLAIYAKYKGEKVSYDVLLKGIAGDVEIQKNLVKESDRTLFEDVLANTSSGLKLNLVW